MRRHALASVAALLLLLLVGAASALQLPHGNFLRNSLHEKQAGAQREAEHSASMSDDGAVTPMPTQGTKPRATQEAQGQAAPTAKAAPAPPKAGQAVLEEEEDEEDDYKRRTLVVTRETSVYLPGPSGSPRSAPRPAGAGPRRGAAAAAGPTAPPSPPANILNTLRRFGFVVDFARWAVQKPGVAAWWLSKNGAALAWDLTWRTTAWSIRNSKAAASWTWEWIIMYAACSSAPKVLPC